MFEVQVTQQAGYSVGVVAQTRSSMTVRIEDDDFYGHVRLAGLVDGDLVDLASLPKNASYATMPKTHWNSGNTVNQTGKSRNVPFGVYLQRSRTPAESTTAFKRSQAMKALTVWVRVDLGSLNHEEFSVIVQHISGPPNMGGVILTEYTVGSDKVKIGDGTTTDMIEIEFPAMATNNTRNVHHAFQWVQILVKSNGVPSGCDVGGEKRISFNLDKAVYPKGITPSGIMLEGTPVLCGLDVERSPLDLSAMATSFVQTLTVAPENSQANAPFRIEFAGFDPNVEETKDKPIAWNAGLDGSFVQFADTEHTVCSIDGDGIGCAPRSFNMHLSATLRDDHSSIIPKWTSWGADTARRFFTLKDSPNEWSQIGNLYDLSCPPAIELVRLSNAAAGASITCDRVSTLELVGAGISSQGHQRAVYCDGAEYEAMNFADKLKYCGDEIPKRLMWTLRTDDSSGRNAFMCPTASNAMAIGAQNPWNKLPYAVFTTKDDKGYINLSRRPSLCLQNGALPSSIASGGNTETCSALLQNPCVHLRIVDDENSVQDNTMIDSDVYLMDSKFETPEWDSIEGRLKLKVEDRYSHSPYEKTLVNVGVGGCDTPSVTYQSFWESYDNSITDNPVTSGGTAFGSCDLLASSNFPQGLDNAQMFDALYGPLSAQPTKSQTSGLVSSGRMFGFGSTDNITETNTLFTSPRDLGSGGA